MFFLISGWWFVTNGKDQGWAPCSYLEGDKDEEEAMTSLGISLCYREDLKFTVYSLSPCTIQEDTQKYYSVDNYEAEEDDEISFKRGAIVDVLQKSMDGWWLVRIDKAVGLAPATFLKKVEVQELDSTSQVCMLWPGRPNSRHHEAIICGIVSSCLLC